MMLLVFTVLFLYSPAVSPLLACPKKHLKIIAINRVLKVLVVVGGAGQWIP